jgi:hypothetical protein
MGTNMLADTSAETTVSVDIRKLMKTLTRFYDEMLKRERAGSI